MSHLSTLWCKALQAFVWLHTCANLEFESVLSELMPKTFTPLSVNFVYSSLNSNSQTLPLICLLFLSNCYLQLLPEAADFLRAPRSCSPGVEEDDHRGLASEA